jgi:predicted Fe-Mo cluster-binding NifX family protein
MRACIPIVDDQGFDSRVHPHFGSAPMFLAVDTESWASQTVPNVEGPRHGRCHRLGLVADEKIEAVIVIGIGPGALERLRSAQVRMYHTTRSTARAALDGIGSGRLAPAFGEPDPDHASGCHGGHGDGGAADHGACRSGRDRRAPVA